MTLHIRLPLCGLVYIYTSSTPLCIAYHAENIYSGVVLVDEALNHVGEPVEGNVVQGGPPSLNITHVIFQRQKNMTIVQYYYALSTPSC